MNNQSCELTFEKTRLNATMFVRVTSNGQTDTQTAAGSEAAALYRRADVLFQFFQSFIFTPFTILTVARLCGCRL